ncbi:hypothetical protein [Lignipirellula cremea]|uniref:hypothetical protein n=1 Tax=Lignipirellula cremea TaxID=2528010 RepID=UPI0011A708BE|nr:hypothetical protein [Lignipirellula cremea]
MKIDFRYAIGSFVATTSEEILAPCGVVVRAQCGLVGGAVKLIVCSLAPMLIMAVPSYLLLSQLAL